VENGKQRKAIDQQREAIEEMHNIVKVLANNRCPSA
jgi:hypothetical protein